MWSVGEPLLESIVAAVLARLPAANDGAREWVALDDMARAREIIAEVRAETEAPSVERRLWLMLDAINGRTTAPTDEELAAHEGRWRSVRIDRNGVATGVDLLDATGARAIRDMDAALGHARRWWALDALIMAPTMWPVVTP